MQHQYRNKDSNTNEMDLSEETMEILTTKTTTTIIIQIIKPNKVTIKH